MSESKDQINHKKRKLANDLDEEQPFKSKVQYKILCNQRLGFQRLINEAISDGWVLEGPMAVVKINDMALLYQMMKKPAKMPQRELLERVHAYLTGKQHGTKLSDKELVTQIKYNPKIMDLDQEYDEKNFAGIEKSVLRVKQKIAHKV